MEKGVREKYAEKLQKGEISEEDLNFIVSYKYKGKTQDEWLRLVNTSKGNHKNGNPKWYRFLSNATDTDVLANVIILGKNKENGKNNRISN